MATAPFPEEVADDDCLELPRIMLDFDKRRTAVLRALIDALNDLAPAGEHLATLPHLAFRMNEPIAPASIAPPAASTAWPC